jgi:hypothetical protein
MITDGQIPIAPSAARSRKRSAAGSAARRERGVQVKPEIRSFHKLVMRGEVKRARANNSSSPAAHHGFFRLSFAGGRGFCTPGAGCGRPPWRSNGLPLGSGGGAGCVVRGCAFGCAGAPGAAGVAGRAFSPACDGVVDWAGLAGRAFSPARGGLTGGSF